MIETSKIYTGDCIEVMKTWPDNFIDTIITDPPYGLEFMGKDWDRGVPGVHFWEEMLRICKPGAMLLSFGGTRTSHRMTCAIEDAGWQIRDCLMWLYGSGFPKSHNLHGQFEGWGTALKPAWEPIIVAMKPIDGTFAENAEKWGVAGINVDGGRIGTNPGYSYPNGPGGNSFSVGNGIDGTRIDPVESSKGRWPSNLLLDEEAAAMLDRQSGATVSKEAIVNNLGSIWGSDNRQPRAAGHSDSGGASRFFYVAKADRAERNEGCDELNARAVHRFGAGIGEGLTPEAPVVEKNHHPTVKPLSLMKYLCNLTRTPTGGIVLDPFAGSGTTLWAAEFHNRPWIGIEMNPEYVAIAEARLSRERAQLKMPI